MTAQLDSSKQCLGWPNLAETNELPEPKFENSSELEQRYGDMLLEVAQKLGEAVNSGDTEGFRFLVHYLIRVLSESCLLAQSKKNDTE